MKIVLEHLGKRYSADLSLPVHIAIALRDGVDNQPNAYGAPPFETFPVVAGDFAGSLEAGSPVNFYNVRVNPHGNGTHTECVGHITQFESSIHDVLNCTHSVAEVVSVYPTKRENGDRVIEVDTLKGVVSHNADSLVVRTLPNDDSKCSRKYTGMNPPYFSEESLQWIHGQGYTHLLTDLPSVDREEDGGALRSHKMFWQLHKNMRSERTITEMVFVSNNVEDGLYLLDIQITAITLDASPSRPVLFKLKPES